MMKRLLSLIPFILLIIGCNETFLSNGNGKPLSFSGESDNWKGEYSVIISENGTREDGDFVFSYKNGSSKTFFRKIEVVINNGETKYIEYGTRGSMVRFFLSSSGGAVMQEDLPIKVTIKWDNEKQESFELESK
jgi:hypothetical protein